MHVVVVGAGVTGVATAYYLAAGGCEITVIDQADEAGDGTSFANGGQLSYSFSEALASPAFLRSLPSLLLQRDIGARIRPGASLLAWGLRFLFQCRRGRFEASSVATYRDALRSAELMHALIDATGIEFAFRRAGKMILLSSDAAVRQAQTLIELKRPYGCDNRIVDGDEACDIEPAIAHFTERPLAANYSPGDDVGDAGAFCRALRRWLEASTPTRFELGVRVDRVTVSGGRCTGVATSAGPVGADAVVVCGGIGSPQLAGGLHIEGMRGYSLTLPTGSHPPSVSITAQDRHFVFSRLDDTIRIAGFADFTGRREVDPLSRLEDLKATAEALGPDAADYSDWQSRGWTGVRPMTPSSRPVVGRTATSGLYCNTGHGMLGWTLACVTGERVTRDLLRG